MSLINTGTNSDLVFAPKIVTGSNNGDTNLPETPKSKYTRGQIEAMSARNFLDEFIVPSLLPSLSIVAKERRSNPVAHLAALIQDKAKMFDDIINESDK